MITLKLSEFRDGHYDDEKEFYKLYILKNSDEVLYIGISKMNVYNRWFGGGGRSHLSLNIYGQWFGSTPIGNYVLSHAPQSDDWIIELWTLEDGLAHFEKELQDQHFCLDRTDIEVIERMMIWESHPLLNTTHNKPTVFIPQNSEEDLQRAHRKVYG